MKTIQDLYNWAKENGSLDLPVGLQYMDSGWYYDGNTWADGNHDICGALDTENGQTYVRLFDD